MLGGQEVWGCRGQEVVLFFTQKEEAPALTSGHQGQVPEAFPAPSKLHFSPA